ncbi:Coiled-coil domain-containing protein 47 [Eumeta japonica]|uniref:PAT complex subunit CCDC47 n=1 Tax=Eumeta variegata TaxID=151549 RepID=A0A4C2A5N0_EUMVA|nr:Coiled-coil domain-containing protein 47 [Eumeta japonica]
MAKIQDDEEDGIVEDEDEFFKDDEEFEGFDDGDAKMMLIKNTRTKINSCQNTYAFQNKYCTLVSKPETRYNVPHGFSVLSEIPEATSAILENRVITALSKYQQYIDYIHISDQFSGVIQQDEANSLKQPETKPVLMAGFNLPKDGYSKAEKNRLRVEEFLKVPMLREQKPLPNAVKRNENRKRTYHG